MTETVVRMFVFLLESNASFLIATWVAVANRNLESVSRDTRCGAHWDVARPNRRFIGGVLAVL
jgi:hypothetical protein